MGLILLRFVGHLWVLFWQWWVMGSEARVICLSFGSFFRFVHGGGGGNRWLQWKRDRGRERREMGENRYAFGLYYFLLCRYIILVCYMINKS